MMITAYSIGVIVGALFAAFFGCRFLKLTITIESAYLGYVLGAEIIGIAIADMFEGTNISLILGVTLGLLFALIAVRLYKGIIYLLGAVCGGALGFMLPYSFLPSFGVEENVSIIVGIVLALILAFVFAKLMLAFFKVLIIISTSFAGALLATTTAMQIAMGEEMALSAVALLASLVLGFMAMLVQFKMNKGRDIL